MATLWKPLLVQVQALRPRVLEEVPVPSGDELDDGFPALRHGGGSATERVAVQPATHSRCSRLLSRAK